MVSRNLRDDTRLNLLLYATPKRQRQPIKKVKFMKKITAIYTDFEQKRKAGAEVSREQMRAERQELDKQVIPLARFPTYMLVTSSLALACVLCFPAES